MAKMVRRHPSVRFLTCSTGGTRIPPANRSPTCSNRASGPRLARSSSHNAAINLWGAGNPSSAQLDMSDAYRCWRQAGPRLADARVHCQGHAHPPSRTDGDERASGGPVAARIHRGQHVGAGGQPEPEPPATAGPGRGDDRAAAQRAHPGAGDRDVRAGRVRPLDRAARCRQHPAGHRPAAGRNSLGGGRAAARQRGGQEQAGRRCPHGCDRCPHGC